MKMADVRTLKLNLLADVDQFNRSLATADDSTKSFSSNIKSYGKVMAKAFALAGAAAGLYAIKLGVDGVKAAVEDEASQAILAKTMQNTTDATNEQIKATEAYISATQLRYGVSDVKLRDSLGILVRATKDVTDAQKINNLAIDISAATGKDLETVSLTLAKAYDGNFTSLRKLGIPLDENILKTKDFDALTVALTDTFGGSAAAKTATYAGQLEIVKERFGEMKEAIGVGLLPQMKLLLENVSLMAKGFSGEDPEGLSNRARELAGNFEGNGANSLGGSLRAVTDAFAGLFSTITEDGDSTTNILVTIAGALETIANAINTASDAYNRALPFFRFLANPLNLNLPEIGLNPRPKTKPKSNAAGGSVMGGQAYRVGEFGVETFIPAGSGSIRPGAGGGGNTVININGVIDAESARRSIEKLLQNSARRTGPINLVGATL
jgi:hypothetical protein